MGETDLEEDAHDAEGVGPCREFAENSGNGSDGAPEFVEEE